MFSISNKFPFLFFVASQIAKPDYNLPCRNIILFRWRRAARRRYLPLLLPTRGGGGRNLLFYFGGTFLPLNYFKFCVAPTLFVLVYLITGVKYGRLGGDKQDGRIPRIEPLEGAHTCGRGAEGVGRGLPILPTQVSHN